ncbi:hypothetical protein HDU76_011456, partial [Blyttiomyces sp. JEL0837]
MGESLALVIESEDPSRIGHVIRISLERMPAHRMGPIPMNSLPFYDLGPLIGTGGWLDSYIKSLESGVRRFVNAPSAFLDVGRGCETEVTRVQLKSRQWRFKFLKGTESYIEGEGVIGQYPLLSLQRPSFSYCSYSSGGFVIDKGDDEEEEDENFDDFDDEKLSLDNPLVSMEGGFVFVVGRLLRRGDIMGRVDEEFLVNVPR